MRYREIAVITGGSKGLGKGIVDQFLSRKDVLIISVSRSKILIEEDNFKQINKDLSHLKGCVDVISMLKLNIDKEVKKITLINNAGRLGDITTSTKVSADDISETIFLNLTAPILLQNALIKYASSTVCVEIVNIISGASNNPYYGWGAYCSSKAGLQMATKVLALEIEQLSLNAKSWALIPGVIDTDMQELIRNSKVEDFKDVDRFIKLKKENDLLSPTFLSQFIVSACDNESFLNGGIYNIKDFV